MSSIIVLFGAPGSGKGTQAEKISEKFKIPSISTGDLIRAEIKNSTELGKKVAEYANQGKLVPDEIVMSIFNRFLTIENLSKGFITDGYPRTLTQAIDLDEQLGECISNSIPIYLEVNTNDLVSRILGRSFCPKCKRVYHDEFKPPEKDGVCDSDGERLQRRADDTEEIIRQRTDIFLSELEPLLNHYGNRMNVINGNQSVGTVFNDVMEVLDGR
jgi:adenylate kinase